MMLSNGSCQFLLKISIFADCIEILIVGNRVPIARIHRYLINLNSSLGQFTEIFIVFFLIPHAYLHQLTELQISSIKLVELCALVKVGIH